MKTNFIQSGIMNNPPQISGGSVLSPNSSAEGKFEQVFLSVSQAKAPSPAGAKNVSKEKAGQSESKESTSAVAQKPKAEAAEKKEITDSNTTNNTETNSANVSTGDQETASGEISGGLQDVETQKTAETESQPAWNLVQPGFAPLIDIPENTDLSLMMKEGESTALGEGSKIAVAQEGVPKEALNANAFGGNSSLKTEAVAKGAEVSATLFPLGEDSSLEDTSLLAATQEKAPDEAALLSNSQKLSNEQAPKPLFGEILKEGVKEAGEKVQTLPEVQTAKEILKEKPASLLFDQNLQKVKNGDGKGQDGTDPLSGKILKTVKGLVQGSSLDAAKPEKPLIKAEASSLKPEIQSLGLEAAPKEVKTAGNEKNYSFFNPKASGVEGKLSSMEASGFQNSGEKGFDGNASGLSGTKSLADLKASAELGAGKVDFQSLMPRENAAAPSTANATGNILNVSSAGMADGRIHDLSRTPSLEKAANPAKPQEVFERSVLEQIVSKATLISKNGQNEMRIQLDPPSLGKVKIQIMVEGEKVSANVLADNSIARDIIERNIHHLRNSLADQGLKVDQMSVNVGSDPRQQAANYERPFTMDKGFSRMDSSKGEDRDLAEQVAASAIKTNFSRDGGISIFI